MAGFIGVAVGVWAYCLLVAPLVEAGSRGEAAAEKASDMGIGYTIVCAVLAALWILAIWLHGRRHKTPAVR